MPGPNRILTTAAHGSNPSNYATSSWANWFCNVHGIPFVLGGHMNIQTLRSSYTTAQTNTAILSLSAGTKLIVTRICALCDNANSVDVQVRIGFGTAATPTSTGVLLAHPGIAPGSGIIEGNGSGIIGIGADDEDLRITSEIPTGGSIEILASYFTIES